METRKWMPAACELGVPICEALGIDPSRVTKLVLTLGPDGGARLDISSYMTGADLPEGFVETLGRYELKLREGEEPGDG